MISSVLRRGASLKSATKATRSLFRASTMRTGRVFSRSFNAMPLVQSTYSRFGGKENISSLNSKLGLLALFGVGAALLNQEDQSSDACGIVAFVGKEPAVDYLLEGLTLLQNRGYDSAGISTLNKGQIVTTKYASKGSTSDSIELLKAEAPKKHDTDHIGVAHTRWATHGGKTDQNAHPHPDQKDRLALVHNGTIENAAKLKAEMQAKGIKFRSETDTEVIAQLIGTYLDEDPNLPVVEAVKKALTRLEGTWGLAIISKDNPDQIIAARNGSPIVVGVGKDKMFVASEVTAFARYTNQYIALNDGEVAVIKADGVSLDLSRIEQAPNEKIELTPEPYPHWTIKEIMEQPEAIGRTLNFGGRFHADGRVKLGGLQANSDLLLGIHHLVIAACGTSYFAGLYGAAMMRNLGAFDTVQVFDASEVGVENFPSKNGGLLVISQSGETKDVHRVVLKAADLLIPRFSVINSVGSLIARTTRCGVYLNAGREQAVASTKAFTTQVTALALIATWFSQNRGNDATSVAIQRRAELVESIHRLPTYAGMTLRVRTQCRDIAQKIKDQNHMFILGKGYAEPIAREGSLKIKEITYLHAEGYGGGALKHGPFALIDTKTPIVLMILDDQHAELMRITAQEVRARGAHTIVITDKARLADGVADDVIEIPSNGPLTALLAVIPLQILAYELSIARGIDPDKPRHLAKAVTVD